MLQVVANKEKKEILQYIKENPNRVRIECNYMDEDGYGFCVYHLLDSDQYFYYELTQDSEEFVKVFPVATLIYSTVNDLRADTNTLVNMFANFCCGETIYDDHVEYRWYDTNF